MQLSFRASIARTSLVLVVTTSVAFGGFFLTISPAYAQNTPATIGPVAGAPASLFIPQIGKRASIVPVDITPAGALDVPHNFVQAGWYDRGPVVGGIGSAVIDGHVDNGAAIPGVFKNLHTLVAGDDIYVTNVLGGVSHFKVTSLDIYSVSAFPSGQIFADSGQPLLKIITCYGTYLPQTGTYNDRLVVTAVLVS